MKKLYMLALMLVFMLGLTSCGGNVDNVQIMDYTSQIFTDAEIRSAIDVTIDYFKKEFEGCTLTQITYLGDDQIGSWQDYLNRYDADDVIVLVSSFDVDASGGDGSLNPNSTYNNWKWILIRNDGKNWKHVDHGY